MKKIKKTPAPKPSAKVKAEAVAKAQHIAALKLRLREPGQIPEINTWIQKTVQTHQEEKQNAVAAIEAGNVWALHNSLNILRGNDNRLTSLLNGMNDNAIMDNNAIQELLKETGMDIMLREYENKTKEKEATAEAVPAEK